MIEIRELTAEDWPIWRELRLAALAEAPYAFGSRLADWQDAPEDRWRERLSIPDSYNLVAELDGRSVGMASGIPAEDDPDAVELISMWVRPAARGRQVGDRLVTAVVDRARDRGVHRVVLAVAAGNPGATALYHRNGFQDADEPPRPMPDGARCELMMVKPLI
ncbi:MAG TPA: GNAT family N-acetyltransferase [Actinomycetes bacterium]|nr:GNAT family N-acetyltransferase [Actinomycetes bacterium]